MHRSATTRYIFQYSNLTIVEKNSSIRLRMNQLEQTVIARFPQHQSHNITTQAIQQAVENQFGAFVSVQDISRPNLIPWNPEYGSVATLAYTYLPTLSSFDHNTSARTSGKPLKQIQIQIYGIPPHLCSRTTIDALLGKLATIHQITLNTTKHTYFVSAETHCLDAIPPTANIGIKRMLHGKLLLNIWPIWYEIMDITLPTLGFTEQYYNLQPDDEATSARQDTDIERFSPVRNSSEHECGCESDRSMNY
ncbi:uncharacterized protein LOC110434519 isoform X3 [Sorghum bicolor]|uniref:Uncharacterized protein n=1 Tax=Sorghum bicolor TaxID=4558 RepID=A0A1Z5RNY0_SORBI|nr:uncharacterized protein LOC110434519 isoform X3 [Sorghum bicolor]OQU85387.1 hypothetical protein SORBI_3004G230600 [Sorghum bicolor]|eukprot:XP_021314348.1 uncharacterized protein LOC110434519 isoform X3 [Sorghum bicolor]